MTKSKGFADGKIDIAKMAIYVFDGVEHTVGKEENAGYQRFLPFPQCFLKSCSLWLFKSQDCVVKS